jgi:hypothetical protein
VLFRSSKNLDIACITITGGEPLLNPDLFNWIHGIIKLWPNVKQLRIKSNGTQLHKRPELYDLIKESNNKIMIWVALHGGESEKLARESITKFFKGRPLKQKSTETAWESIWQAIKGSDWPDCTIEEFEFLPDHIKKECKERFNFNPENFNWDEHVYTDDNGVEIYIEPNSKLFHTTSIVFDEKIQNLRFHNSDPKKAFDICAAKICKSSRLFKGKLYKCGPLPSFQDAIDQFSIKLSESDRQLIKSYTPAESTWNQTQLETFKEGLNHHIDQCKFCPEAKDKRYVLLTAGTKKRKIYPIVDNNFI